MRQAFRDGFDVEIGRVGRQHGRFRKSGVEPRKQGALHLQVLEHRLDGEIDWWQWSVGAAVEREGRSLTRCGFAGCQLAAFDGVSVMRSHVGAGARLCIRVRFEKRHLHACARERVGDGRAHRAAARDKGMFDRRRRQARNLFRCARRAFGEEHVAQRLRLLA